MNADNPNAFPMSASTGDPRDGVYCQSGMTLRDYFAAKAMQGALAANDHEHWESEIIAQRAYALADAMLEARGL